jgi:hypothetical protein
MSNYSSPEFSGTIIRESYESGLLLVTVVELPGLVLALHSHSEEEIVLPQAIREYLNLAKREKIKRSRPKVTAAKISI